MEIYKLSLDKELTTARIEIQTLHEVEEDLENYFEEVIEKRVEQCGPKSTSNIYFMKNIYKRPIITVDYIKYIYVGLKVSHGKVRAKLLHIRQTNNCKI